MDVHDLTQVKLKQTIANFVIPLVAVILSLGLLAFYIYPSFTDIPELNSELDSASTLANQLEDKALKLNTLLDFKQNVDDSTALVSKALSEEPLVPQLLTQIDLIAKESGLVVNKMGYALNETAGADVGNYKVVVVNVSVQGNYNQLITFLGNLEKSSRVINVSTFRFGVDDDDGIVEATLVLTSPYVDVSAQANTDEPITFEITDPSFQNLMEKLKSLRHYEISVENYIDINQLPGEEASPEDGTDGVTETPAPETTPAPVEESPPVVEQPPVENPDTAAPAPSDTPVTP